MDRKNKMKNIINVVLLLVSVGILAYFCISNDNLATLIGIFPQLDHFWLATAWGAIFSSWFLDSMVIRGIASQTRRRKFGKLASLKITMTGQYFSAITPLGVGGQPVQILSLTEMGIPAGKAISILVRKFLIYQSTMACYSLVVIVFSFGTFGSRLPAFVPLSLIGFGSQCFIVAALVLFYVNKSFTVRVIRGAFDLLSKIKIIKNPESWSKKVEDQLNFFIENNKSMRGDRRLTAKLYFLTFLQLTFLFSVPFFVYKAFRYNGYPLIELICAQAFVTMISSYTPLPGAAGTTEGSFLVIFGGFFADVIINQAMILCRFISYYSSIILGFIVIKINPKRKASVKSAGVRPDASNVGL